MFLGDEAFESLKGALIEASLILKGTVNPDERAPGGHELIVSSAELIGGVRAEAPFPITESAMEAADGGETEFLLDNPTSVSTNGTYDKYAQDSLQAYSSAIHSYFRNRDFTEYQAPNFVVAGRRGWINIIRSSVLWKKGISYPILATIC